MRKWITFNRVKKAFLGFLLAFLILLAYDQLMLSSMPPKTHVDDLRIGFINLHENKIPAKALRKLTSYDCDIWLFIEWNGDNLDNLPAFSTGYSNRFELADAQTYGLHVLAKDSTIQVMEVGKEKRPYACDYPKHWVSHQDFNLFLAHAPPPLPGCKFETVTYISDLLEEVALSNHASTLIVGDFNTLPFQSSISKIKEAGFQDAHHTVNTMPVGTFGPTTWFPKILKFDYIFYRGDIIPVQVERFVLSSSDHAGWIVDFRI